MSAPSSPVINGALLSQALSFGPDSWMSHEWAPASQAPELSAVGSDIQSTSDRIPSSIHSQDYHGSVRSGSRARDSFDSVSGDPVNHQQSYGDNWPLRGPTYVHGVGSNVVMPENTPLRRRKSFAASICSSVEPGFVSPITQDLRPEASIGNNAGSLTSHTISPLEPIANSAGKVRADEQQGYARTGDGGFASQLLQEMDVWNTGPPMLSLDSRISAPGGGSSFSSHLPMFGYNRDDGGAWDPKAYRSHSLEGSQAEMNHLPASIRTEQRSTFTGDHSATIDENSQPRLHEQSDIGLRRNAARNRRRRMPDNASADLGSLSKGTSYEESVASVGRDNLSRPSSGSRDISQASTNGYGQDNAFGDYRGQAQPTNPRRFAEDVPRIAQVSSRPDHTGDEYPKPLQRALSPQSKKSRQPWTRRWFRRKPAKDTSEQKQMHDFCHGLKKDPGNCGYCMAEDDTADYA
ncbi:hypothetical protein HD553DRAFT_362803 [Filobasidium floriforme]|uniref:uncharacterized protein n=1 Tax=Filobasidium floriforme TaxID=5210 RepID=UPI001E8E19CB|nr:uncharacterized protein HD553DRAFT_362803 [Filobasidium floriforme]KAH8079627.1 hypothetical protein HD553DRAFT_362803 [Filobasidium floriforme]